jgi:NAD/NADP transhydrogenase beta subunit
MSATWAGMAVAIVATGALMSPEDARWVWAIGSALLAAAAVVGYVLAREPAPAPARQLEATS